MPAVSMVAFFLHSHKAHRAAALVYSRHMCACHALTPHFLSPQALSHSHAVSLHAARMLRCKALPCVLAGTAIGLNLLFKIPPVTCILLTGLDALVLLLVLPQAGVRRAEQWTAGLVAAVLACFIVDLLLSRPPLREVVSGLVPTLHREGIYSAVRIDCLACISCQAAAT